MNKKIILLILAIFTTCLIAISSVSAAATVKETVNIKNGMNNLVEPYGETALNGKFNLRVDNNLRAHVSVSNYKKLVGLKVSCYFVTRTTHMNSYGRPSTSTLSVGSTSYSLNPRVNESKRTSKGYNSNSDFSYAMTGGLSNPGVIHSIELEFEKQPDLKLEKISKKSGQYVVNIKNTGDANAKANKIGVYVNKKLIKTVTIPSIKAGKSKNVGVKVDSKYNKSKKTFKIDYNNKINEIYENNNAKVAV
ncbi:MAG: hypothetical protein FWH29_03335 [Methanobrevibacter sp.]|nr:hypothetical protein [Methanobrevibacter sp.]